MVGSSVTSGLWNKLGASGGSIVCCLCRRGNFCSCLRRRKKGGGIWEKFYEISPSSLLSPFLAPRFRDCLFGGAGAASNSKEGKRKIRRGRRLNNVFPRTDRPNDRLLARSASVDRASGEEGGSSKSERRAIAQRSGNRFGVGGAFATLSDVGRSFSRR